MISAIPSRSRANTMRRSAFWIPLLGLVAASLQQAPPSDAPIAPPVITTPSGSAAVEQTTHGERPGAVLVESFDGLGVGFTGPQGTATLRNPSDNTLAVGPNHIVQIVN